MRPPASACSARDCQLETGDLILITTQSILHGTLTYDHLVMVHRRSA